MTSMMNDIILSFIGGTVMIIVGLYFKKNIYSEIGSNGVSLPAAKENKAKWLYAQAIGPEILIKNGLCLLVVIAAFDVSSLFFHVLQNLVPIITMAITVGFLILNFMITDSEISKFSPEWLTNGDDMTKNRWIATATEYAKNNQYSKLYEFVTAKNKS